MSTAEVLEQLRHLNNSERLAVIETATRLIRADLAGPAEELERRMGQAALAAKEFYEPGGVLTEWTCLDAEDFVDDSGQG